MAPDTTPNPHADDHSAGDNTPPYVQPSDPPARSYLFLVRVWESASSEDAAASPGHEQDEQGAEWHGKAQNVVTGEARRFDGLDSLGSVLSAMTGGAKPNSGQ